MIFYKKKKIYLDYAASTPIDKKVFSLMQDINKNNFANASSIHSSGYEVKNTLESARKKVATLLNAHSDEIVFTNSASSSIGLSLIGIVRAYKKDFNTIPHIITSNIEHDAVLENIKHLDALGEIEATYVEVASDGIVRAQKIEDFLRPNTLLVSIMYANNEIGTIQPIEEIAKAVRHYRKKQNSIFPFFHTDATQAMNYLFVSNVEKLGVDLLSFNSSKIYGPKGVGVLYKKRGIKIEPLYRGGGQEYGLYSGTENVSSIAGASLALEIACKEKEKENLRLKIIQDYAIENLIALGVETGYNITLNGHRTLRLVNNINISLDGIASELLVIELDSHGIEVSEKSACGASDSSTSHVIQAINNANNQENKEYASIRISLGRDTKMQDIVFLISKLKYILNKYKSGNKMNFVL